MNFIITPLAKVISKLTLVWRFVIITLIVGITLVLLASNSIRSQLEERRHTNLELQGMDLILPSVNILTALQSLRTNALIEQLNPETAKKDQIEMLRAEIDKSFAELAEYSRKNTDLNMQGDYDKLYNGWVELKAKQKESSTDQFHLYDAFINDCKDFLKTVVAKSKLSIDSNVDIYYFVQMIGIQFPDLIESFTMLRDLSYKALTKKIVDDGTLIYLGYELAVFEQNMSTLEHNINYVSGADASRALKSQTQEVIKSLNNVEIRSFLEQHLFNKTLDADAITFSQSVEGEIKGTTILFDKIAASVKEQLVDRSHHLRNDIITRMTLCVVMLLFIGFIFAAFYRSTKDSLELATDTANEIANGNLLSDIPSDCKDDFKILFEAFTAMQGNLSEIVNDINEVSSTVNNSAREIASGNANLSERTQEQASALVETAASLNNLTDTVKKNADSARDATDLADKSSNIAEQGREAVGKVLITMGEINNSAQKIQEITSVIDSIAFQTNLLALNASVEAARAGEQGRGFAVVASEVRNLAQRSSDAAKQIKQLINDSMSKVEAGDKQVKLTADTMQEILQSITQVNEIVKLISIASTEQSNGIEQINIVVSGMEETTQKNAALVEEAAASAELLEKQSSKLVDVMNRFDVA